MAEAPSIDRIRGWLTESLFGAWLENPVGLWPLVRIPQELADDLGSKVTVAKLSSQTAEKKIRQHPALSILDYGHAQEEVTTASEIIRCGATKLIFGTVPQEAHAHIRVVQATG